MVKKTVACKVYQAGVADDGGVYILLNHRAWIGVAGRPALIWLCALDSQRKEMLATALASITSDLMVDAQVEIDDSGPLSKPKQNSTIYQLYLKCRAYK